jgi:acetyltransferase-like isoleucine patch superfamily enzyme
MDVTVLWYKYIVALRYRRKFGQFGQKSLLLKPLKIQGHPNISIGDHTQILNMGWLAALPLNGLQGQLKIGSHVQIGHFCHIIATQEVIIEDHVLTADKVYISDNVHAYENPEIPILAQGIRQLSAVRIGSGTWIGENACIIGAKIGRNCVIGANAVVTKDIPDYCVAVGVPARIIKKFNVASNLWETYGTEA